MKPNWTMDASGRSNGSPAFERAMDAVAEILRNHMLGADPRDTARIIVARLAHAHGLAPSDDALAAVGDIRV